ncbi:unnamed protein product [Brassica oleracea]
MMSDNLSGMFPNTFLYISGLSLDSKQVFAITTTLIVLPTVWLRDLSLLSYLSAGGVFSSILLALCLFWAGSVGRVGFHLSGKALDLTNLPVAIEIYGFDFGSHSVFPNIYSSMKGPSKFPLVLLISFAFCTLFYIAVAVCGYTMFGRYANEEIRFNHHSSRAKPRITHTILVKIKMRSKGVSMLFRSVLVLSTLVVALTVPFFATVAALIFHRNAYSKSSNFLYFQCSHKILTEKNCFGSQIGICIFIVIIGVVSGCCGTCSAIARLIGEMA